MRVKSALKESSLKRPRAISNVRWCNEEMVSRSSTEAARVGT